MTTKTHNTRVLWIVIHLVCIAAASGSIATPNAKTAPITKPPTVQHLMLEVQRPLIEAQRPRAEEPPILDETHLEPEEESRNTTLRRLRGREMNIHLVRKANEIIKLHHKEPYGTDIPFELDGKSYVGRIERHFHPPGGKLHPWGDHPGCSLFIVEPAE